METEKVPIYVYLEVDPLRDYWYPDLEKGVWIVERLDPFCIYTKPIRPEDYIKKPETNVVHPR